MSFLQALSCKNQGRPPIWLMRQAGRYLPEYLALKKGKRLYDLFHDPLMITKITKLPVDILHVDAAILFSDILTVLDGMDIPYDFLEGVGPVVQGEVAFALQDPKKAYAFLTEAIQELKTTLKVPLIGFAGGPFTIACYLIEKQTSRDQKKTKMLLYSDEAAFQKIIDHITEATILYLQEQVKAGVDAIQLFDSWGHVLGTQEFRRYCVKPMEKILSTLNVPSLLFCRGSSFYAEELSKIFPSAISIDWLADMGTIRKKVPPPIALQGNLDPMALYGSKDNIKMAANRILEAMKGDPGFIFNLGHGLLPDLEVEKVKFLVDYVQNYN